MSKIDELQKQEEELLIKQKELQLRKKKLELDDLQAQVESEENPRPFFETEFGKFVGFVLSMAGGWVLLVICAGLFFILLNIIALICIYFDVGLFFINWMKEVDWLF